MTKERDATTSSKLKKGFYIVAGTIFLGLGAIGIFIPILPTTPFLLLSAACYYKGSERLHRWMLNNRWFGSYIKNYKEGKGISLRNKAFIIALLWSTIIYSIIFVVNILIIQMALLIIAFSVSLHILKIPTMTREDIEPNPLEN
ncbi:YbaN family protein [Candidatus Bathyarchaeota archaeon]|nr:YbaN family protein [Candidatus Bathyarchaeota archaeon]